MTPVIDMMLAQVRRQLDLDAETERELVEELRGHFEDTVVSARARGVSEEEALNQVAERFGLDDVGRELQAAHVGRGTAHGVMAAALPVVCALILAEGMVRYGVSTSRVLWYNPEWQ